MKGERSFSFFLSAVVFHSLCSGVWWTGGRVVGEALSAVALPATDSFLQSNPRFPGISYAQPSTLAHFIKQPGCADRGRGRLICWGSSKERFVEACSAPSLHMQPPNLSTSEGGMIPLHPASPELQCRRFALYPASYRFQRLLLTRRFYFLPQFWSTHCCR